MSSHLSKKLVPKRLEEDLNNIPKFKPVLKEPRRTLPDVLNQNVEQAMYDEIFGPLINRKSDLPISAKSSSIASSSAKSTNGDSANKERDLNVSVLTRLTDCEREIKTLRRQLAEKIQQVMSLEDENEALKTRVDEPEVFFEEMEFLRLENIELTQRLDEMEKFLSDYGLVWVGGANGKGSNGEAKDAESNGVAVTFHEFAAKVDALNQMIGDEPSRVVASGKQARLMRPTEIVEKIKSAFYRNGLMIKRGPFRQVGSAS